MSTPAAGQRQRHGAELRPRLQFWKSEAEQPHGLGVVLHPRTAKQFAEQEHLSEPFRVLGQAAADQPGLPDVAGEVPQLCLLREPAPEFWPSHQAGFGAGEGGELLLVLPDHVGKPVRVLPQPFEPTFNLRDLGRVGVAAFLHRMVEKRARQGAFGILLQLGRQPRHALPAIGEGERPSTGHRQVQPAGGRLQRLQHQRKPVANEEGRAVAQRCQGRTRGFTAAIHVPRRAR